MREHGVFPRSPIYAVLVEGDWTMLSDWIITKVYDYEGANVVAVIDKSATPEQLQAWVDKEYPDGTWSQQFTKDLGSGTHIEIDQYEVVKL